MCAIIPDHLDAIARTLSEVDQLSVAVQCYVDDDDGVQQDAHLVVVMDIKALMTLAGRMHS